jgi:hypothetical protein
VQPVGEDGTPEEIRHTQLKKLRVSLMQPRQRTELRNAVASSKH